MFVSTKQKSEKLFLVSGQLTASFHDLSPTPRGDAKRKICSSESFFEKGIDDR